MDRLRAFVDRGGAVKAFRRHLRAIGASDALRKLTGVYWPPELPPVTRRPESAGAGITVIDGVAYQNYGTPTQTLYGAPFEVNMMECLVGWKGWFLVDGLLCSPTYPRTWAPDKPFKAHCDGYCPEVPGEGHSCGIYAADDVARVTGHYGAFVGEVWGWGRYIRGNSGWRAQFVYPKSFHLNKGQADLIEGLKKYHVPIFIDEPLRIYDPREEGYYGYGNDQEDGHCRAPEAAPSDEEGDCDAQATGG